MKKLLSLLIMLLPLMVNAQKKQSVVTLKNGTELKGIIKSIDPMDAVIIEIAGFETTIKMTEVAKIEVTQNSSANNIAKKETPHLSSDDKLVVTDFGDYPDYYDFSLGNAKIKMILVRGGEMNMGYNGRHSISMKSEPVHKVKVSSFYISEGALRCEQIKGLGIDYKFKDNQPAKIKKWDIAKYLVDIIASKTGKEYRLPTEAEWEYAACCNKADVIFEDALKNKNIEYDWCSDFYGSFYDITQEEDPNGPITGKEHVVRAYKSELGKFDRSNRITLNGGELGFVRLVIKANAKNNNN